MSSSVRAVVVVVAAVLLPAAPTQARHAHYSRAEEIRPGTARWSIKTSVPPGARLDAARAVPFEDLIALPDPPGVRKNDRRYRHKRIPPFTNDIHVREGDIVSTVAWLQLIALERDGDYHVQLSARPEDGNNCLIVEVPYPDAAFEADPVLGQRAAQVRTKLRSLLPGKREPPARGVLVPKRVRIQATGQLFYDDAHVGDPPRGKRGMKAATLWEIHPVTSVEVLSVGP